MNNFSYTRFCNVMRRDLAEHRRTYFAFFGILIIAHTLIHFFGNLIGVTEGRFPVQLFLMMGTFALGSCFALSLTYAHIDTKERRISNFMLPASNFEKALSRHLLAFLGFGLIFLVSYLCSEVIQAAYVAMAHGVDAVAKQSLLVNLFKIDIPTEHLHELLEMAQMVPWMFLGVHLFASSLFVLGSAYFRKKAFIKVTLIMFVLNPGMLLSETILEQSLGIQIGYTLLIVAMSVGVLYLAYRRYCRLQVL